MVKNIILSLFLVVSASLHAQENPKIGREAFSSAP
jgi:hypothetical protein